MIDTQTRCICRERLRDTNYIFLSFVTRYLPAGVVGLIIAVIFSAAMSSTSGEINSLATVTVIDIYRRHVKGALRSSLSDGFAHCHRILGSLRDGIRPVRREFRGADRAGERRGSLFYGGLLGVFVLAFFFKIVGANAAFYGVMAGEAAIFATISSPMSIPLVQRDRLFGRDSGRSGRVESLRS